MTSLYLLYVVDTSISGVESDYPRLEFQDKVRYPLIWIGTTTSVNTGSVLYDKRSTYMKFKNQKRYYSEYMELFKFIDTHDYIPTHLKACFHNLESGIKSDLITDRLMHYLFYYRFYYGDRLILNPSYLFLLEKQLKLFKERVPETITASADDRRERLNAKSKRYYARNKEIIKARRDQRKHDAVPDAVIENTAQ